MLRVDALCTIETCLGNSADKSSVRTFVNVYASGHIKKRCALPWIKCTKRDYSIRICKCIDEPIYLVIARTALYALENALELSVEEERQSVPGDVAGDGGSVTPEEISFTVRRCVSCQSSSFVL